MFSAAVVFFLILSSALADVPLVTAGSLSSLSFSPPPPSSRWTPSTMVTALSPLVNSEDVRRLEEALSTLDAEEERWVSLE